MEKLLEQVLQERYHKTIREASSQEIYTALLLITKDKMKHMKRNEGKKKLVLYFSRIPYWKASFQQSDQSWYV